MSPQTPETTQPKTSDAQRAEVARAYTTALERSRGKADGCGCGCTSEPAATTHPAGAAARLAGYGTETETHADAAVSSFGCGNPLAFAGVEPGQTVVDLGSGAGFDLLIAAEKVGPEGRVIGIDMTDAMITAARENAARRGFDQVEVRKGLIEELPLADASADWVISNCVINLSPEKGRVFAEIHRVLKPGGRFSISDIVAEELPPAVRDHAAAYAACIAGAIPEAEYVAGLAAAGLEAVEVTERNVYTAEQLRGIVGSDLADFGLAADTFGDEVYAAVAGRVWSARFVGRRPVSA